MESDIFWVVLSAILILQAIICAALASNLAEKKGYSAEAWLAAGFFFGVIGLIAAAGLPPKDAAVESDTLSKAGVTKQIGTLFKTCPKCSEDIKIEAKVCRYCGQSFGKEDVISQVVAAAEVDINSQIQAADVLKKMQDESATPHLERILSRLLSEASDHKIRTEAAKHLIDIGSTSALFSVLKRGLRQGAVEAAEILRDKKGPAIISGYIDVLEDGSLYGKELTIEILGDMRDPTAVPALVKILQSETYDPTLDYHADYSRKNVVTAYMKEAAILALSKISHESTISALIDLLADGTLSKRARATLVKMGSPAISQLEEAAKTKEKSIAKLARKVLAEIRDKG